jgi:K+-transporting ATPase ATPase C chain
MKSFILGLKVLILFTVMTGVLYPLLIFTLARILFPDKADGSIIYLNGIPVGSRLIGQNFDSSVYFFSRPSEVSYNALPSGGSNLGPTNNKLREQVEKRKEQFIKINNPGPDTDIPPEMLFSSASGLDPHISARAAILQVNRISYVRRFNPVQKQKLINLILKHTEPPQFGIIGEERINVLLLNLDLDKL